MNYQRLKGFVETKVFLDLDHIKENALRVNYDLADPEAWFVIDPTKYENEENLAAIINAKAEIKRSFKGAPFGNQKSSMPKEPLE